MVLTELRTFWPPKQEKYVILKYGRNQLSFGVENEIVKQLSRIKINKMVYISFFTISKLIVTDNKS